MSHLKMGDHASKLPRRSSRLALMSSHSHSNREESSPSSMRSVRVPKRAAQGESSSSSQVQIPVSISHSLTSQTTMSGCEDSTQGNKYDINNTNDVVSIGPVKKRIRYTRGSSILEEVQFNAVQSLDPNIDGRIKFSREEIESGESATKTHVATPSPTHLITSHLSQYHDNDLSSTSIALLQSPTKSSTSHIPPGVVDLSIPKTRLLPLRPSPTDTNTSFILTYGDTYYDSKFLLDKGRDSIDNEIYQEDTSQGRWSDTNYKKYSPYRAWLIDWLSRNIGMRFRLNNETLHVAVGILDRYLESADIEGDMLLCLGCTCMLMASKLEEEQFPSISDINAILHQYTEGVREEDDDACNVPRFVDKQDFLTLEAHICSVLKFNLQVPLMHHFVDRFLHASTAGDGRCWPNFPNDHLECLVYYYMDLSLLEYSFSRTLRNHLVAAAVFLARVVLGQVSRDGVLWTTTLAFYTKNSIDDLEDAVLKLRELHHSAYSKFPNTFAKFSHDAYKNVADRPAPSREQLLNHFECS